MMTVPNPLIPGIKFRTLVRNGGALYRTKRPEPEALPAAPIASSTGSAFLFICPITKDYVVAAQADVGRVSGRRIACYQTFKDRKAAIMYALAVGG